jgi:DksA/TraR C4-type zinc finger protein
MIEKQRGCARCRGEIPAERLAILPETRLCVACSKAVGGEFDITIVTENLAKAGSLKKNYGGVSVRKRRRPIEPLPE